MDYHRYNFLYGNFKAQDETAYTQLPKEPFESYCSVAGRLWNE